MTSGAGRELTLVSPRYGADIHGGAEQAARSLAVRLAVDGWTVRVLTTCARDYVSWADEYPPGSSVEEGVEVHRFGVDRLRDADLDRLSSEILPQAASLHPDTAWDWIDRQGPDSPGLLDAIAGIDSGVLAFTPYLYQPTARGIGLARVPTVLHAAAHAEAPLDLPIFREVFGQADALSHFSRAEQHLVLHRFPSTRRTPQVVLGLPVEYSGSIDPEAARSALGLGDEPFVVALGRIERGKGSHDLVERFGRFREERGGGRLVLAGPVVDAPPTTDGVICLGPVPSEHKMGLLAAADVLVNPSPNESFSIVVPEAFLAGTPVLVNGWCGPLREHCENSSGGLWYTGLADFDVGLGRLLDDEAMRRRLGAAGRSYTEDFFSWESVRGRYERLLDQLG